MRCLPSPEKLVIKTGQRIPINDDLIGIFWVTRVDSSGSALDRSMVEGSIHSRSVVFSLIKLGYVPHDK